MINQELAKGFLDNLRSGYNENMLIERALSLGWQTEEVHDSLELAKKELKKIDSPEVELSGDNKQDVLESYQIDSNCTDVVVDISREGSTVKYILNVPEIGTGTLLLLSDIREQLISEINITVKEIADSRSFNWIKERLMYKASSILDEKIPNESKEIKQFMIAKLIQDMVGLGEIEFLISDINLEEIVILSSKEPIRVYHKKYGWLSTNLRIPKEDAIVNYSNIIARGIGKQITVLAPLLDAHLSTGDRINAILYPISTKGNTITIRRFSRDPYTIIDLINNNTCNIEIAVLLWLAIEYEMNVLISGGTASGKTVLLNACMPFIPPNHRIVSVEDTRELMLPDFLYWCPLVTRLPNPEGKGEVNMLDLLVNSLRMRPDRIVLGEMRRQEEAMVLFEAMHTGHSVYATLHADSAAETISRLTHPPLSIPPNLLRAVNLNVVLFRDRKRRIRRVLQVAEFEENDENVVPNIIYRWIPEEDKIVEHSKNTRFFEKINKITGMSDKELKANFAMKKKILNWISQNKMRSLKEMGKIMNLYYIDRPRLMAAVEKNDKSIVEDKSSAEN